MLAEAIGGLENATDPIGDCRMPASVAVGSAYDDDEVRWF